VTPKQASAGTLLSSGCPSTERIAVGGKATAGYAPAVITSSGPGQLNKVRGAGPGHANKKDGKP